jgi:hypothetical protein
MCCRFTFGGSWLSAGAGSAGLGGRRPSRWSGARSGPTLGSNRQSGSVSPGWTESLWVTDRCLPESLGMTPNLVLAIFQSGVDSGPCRLFGGIVICRLASFRPAQTAARAAGYAWTVHLVVHTGLWRWVGSAVVGRIRRGRSILFWPREHLYPDGVAVFFGPLRGAGTVVEVQNVRRDPVCRDAAPGPRMSPLACGLCCFRWYGRCPVGWFAVRRIRLLPWGSPSAALLCD